MYDSSTMFIIDFKSSAFEAFTHGWIKGLAAPVMLFHRETAPSIPPVQYIDPRKQFAANSMEGDWHRILGDVNRVISNNVPAKTEIPPTRQTGDFVRR